ALAGQQLGPGGGDVEAQGGDCAEAGDDHATVDRSSWHKSNGAAWAEISRSCPGKRCPLYLLRMSSMYLMTSPTLWSFSASSSGISWPNSSSSAMTNST